MTHNRSINTGTQRARLQAREKTSSHLPHPPTPIFNNNNHRRSGRSLVNIYIFSLHMFSFFFFYLRVIHAKRLTCFSPSSVVAKAFILAVHNSVHKQKRPRQKGENMSGGAEGAISTNVAPYALLERNLTRIRCNYCFTA